MIRLAVQVRRDAAETVLAELLELVPAGLEERDLGADLVEYVLYGAEGELPPPGTVRAVAGDAMVDVISEELPDDWDERWRTFHAPVDVPGLRVRPPWCDPAPGVLDVVIDPGQAFGTGSHPTTRLCLELLTGLEPAGPLADWGCGSGVLAVAAAKLGWAPVLACDIEPESVAATAVAAQVNAVRVDVTRADVRAGGGPDAPTVVANLVRPLLLDVARGLRHVPQRLLASGLQTDEVDEIVRAFAPHGLAEARRREGGGWAAVELVR